MPLPAPDLVALLRRENPWLDDPGRWSAAVGERLPPRYIDRRQPEVAGLDDRGLDEDKATLLIGPRQAGKSTWTWHHFGRLPPRVLFVDCELHRLRAWCRDPGEFLADLHAILPEPAAVFLEEAQHLEEAGLFVKGVIDRRLPCPLVVTGSSSYHLAAGTRESLAGRARRARLFPLSLGEVCSDLEDLAPALREAQIQERFRRHLVVGGYPAVWLSEAPETELSALVEAFVIRDASDLYRVERLDAFRALLKLAARQIGSVVNLSEWASLVGVSVPTVSAYLALMEESHLLVRLPPFAGGRRAELTKSPKIYFVDVGLRNHLVGNLSPFEQRADRGPLLENHLFSELWKALPFATSLHWWRTRSGAEVDFVVSEGDRRVGIEVKAARMTRPGLSRGARSFLQAYQPDRLLVANLELTHEETVEGCVVEWLPATEVVARAREVLELE